MMLSDRLGECVLWLRLHPDRYHDGHYHDMMVGLWNGTVIIVCCDNERLDDSSRAPRPGSPSAILRWLHLNSTAARADRLGPDQPGAAPPFSLLPAPTVTPTRPSGLISRLSKVKIDRWNRNRRFDQKPRTHNAAPACTSPDVQQLLLRYRPRQQPSICSS